MVVGEHEWEERRYRYRPDPYGRWIVGADLLPIVDRTGYGTEAERDATARALHQLASTAGRNGALADEPVYDALIADLRAGLPRGALRAWDLLAPPSTQLVADREEGFALADALVDAAVRAHPELEPAGRVDGLAVRVVLMHGHGDRLIPFTETFRLASLLPATARPVVRLTRLFGHAKTQDSTVSNPIAFVSEALLFAGTASEILERVET